MKDKFKVDIVKHIGNIKVNGNGWSKELNIVSWNGKHPQYDIREWDPDHQRMARGLTFTDAEMETLVMLYQKHHADNANC